jgi:hypothetical protein
MDRTVITESRAAYKNYEECVVDAREQGYIFQPSPVLRKNSIRAGLEVTPSPG